LYYKDLRAAWDRLSGFFEAPDPSGGFPVFPKKPQNDTIFQKEAKTGPK
jgi:hypothetical protein